MFLLFCLILPKNNRIKLFFTKLFHFHIIGVKGYYDSVQPPLSEIPGSAPVRYEITEIISEAIVANITYFVDLERLTGALDVKAMRVCRRLG